MTNKTYRTGDLAEMFDVHQNTIRSYVDKIPQYLSQDATAQRRKYTEQDAKIVYTVVKMRDIGIAFDDIVIAISEGRIEDSLPEVDTPEAEQAKDNVELVTIPRDTLLIEQQELIYKIDTLTKELETTKQALSTANEDVSSKQTRIIELERDLAGAKAQLEIIKQERYSSLFWLPVLIGLVLAAMVITALVVYVIAQ